MMNQQMIDIKKIANLKKRGFLTDVIEGENVLIFTSHKTKKRNKV